MTHGSVTILQHSSTVRPYALFQLFENKNVPVNLCTFVPSLHALGWNKPQTPSPLIILGGPQSVYDEEANPWLSLEIDYVKKCIEEGHKVFGICLGGQLLAHILGAKVYKSQEPEVGWYPVQISEHAKELGLEHKTLNFFQWHFDAFETPPSAVQLFSGSSPNVHQGFLWKEQVLGIQFHPEMTHDGALLLCNRFNVPMGTQFNATPCRETDFKKYSDAALNTLEKIITWFLN